jgi:hypothetical protein
MDNILAAIKAERARQDEQWGGPEHDDTHDETAWNFYRSKFEDRILNYGSRRGQQDYPTVHRDALVKIVALAVAQIEQIDRQHPTSLSEDA